MDDLYREQILEHHRRPHNQTPLAAPSVSLEGRNPNCGDVINLQLQLDDAGTIVDVAFSGRGCAISQAGTSDRKSTRLNSSHVSESRMPSSA